MEDHIPIPVYVNDFWARGILLSMYNLRLASVSVNSYESTALQYFFIQATNEYKRDGSEFGEDKMRPETITLFFL